MAQEPSAQQRAESPRTPCHTPCNALHPPSRVNRKWGRRIRGIRRRDDRIRDPGSAGIRAHGAHQNPRADGCRIQGVGPSRTRASGWNRNSGDPTWTFHAPLEDIRGLQDKSSAGIPRDSDDDAAFFLHDIQDDLRVRVFDVVHGTEPLDEPVEFACVLQSDYDD